MFFCVAKEHRCSLLLTGMSRPQDLPITGHHLTDQSTQFARQMQLCVHFYPQYTTCKQYGGFLVADFQKICDQQVHCRSGASSWSALKVHLSPFELKYTILAAALHKIRNTVLHWSVCDLLGVKQAVNHCRSLVKQCELVQWASVPVGHFYGPVSTLCNLHMHVHTQKLKQID